MRLLILLLVVTAYLGSAEAASPRPRVAISTNHGVIICELFPEQAPVTVATFLGLATGTRTWTDHHTQQPVTRPFYDGLTFHRVIADFMIQGGCPLGTGQGGPGFTFADEINATSLGLDREKVLPQGVNGELNQQCAYLEGKWLHEATLRTMVQLGYSPSMTAIEGGQYYRQARTQLMTDRTREQRFELFGLPLPTLDRMSLKQLYERLGYTYRDDLPASSRPVQGALCMANSGPNTNGSQFFINLVDTPHLTGKHTVFGRVVEGMKTVTAIGAATTDPATGAPLTPMTITSIRPIGE